MVLSEVQYYLQTCSVTSCEALLTSRQQIPSAGATQSPASKPLYFNHVVRGREVNLAASRWAKIAPDVFWTRNSVFQGDFAPQKFVKTDKVGQD